MSISWFKCWRYAGTSGVVLSIARGNQESKSTGGGISKMPVILKSRKCNCNVFLVYNSWAITCHTGEKYESIARMALSNDGLSICAIVQDRKINFIVLLEKSNLKVNV